MQESCYKKENHSSPSTPRVKPITISVIRGQTTDFVLSKQIQHGRLHWMLDTKCISNSPITQYICLPSPAHSKQDTSLTSYLSIKRNRQNNRDKQQKRRKTFSLFKCKVFLDSICVLPPRMLWSPLFNSRKCPLKSLFNVLWYGIWKCIFFSAIGWKTILEPCNTAAENKNMPISPFL